MGKFEVILSDKAKKATNHYSLYFLILFGF